MMKAPVVVIGLGEMGGVFARALLRLGHPVYPVTRAMDIAAQAAALPEPEMVLLAVGENDLQASLAAMPPAWRKRLALLQNELLPRDWESHDLDSPTVISVWFEKKKGQDVKVLLPSPAWGPQAALLRDALATLDIPARVVDEAADMLFELVLKNVYILTTNIAGLEVGGNVENLWASHQDMARAVAGDVMDIQFWLCGKELPRERLINGMVEAFHGDPAHACMGRSAPARLARALQQAAQAKLPVPTLKDIAARR